MWTAAEQSWRELEGRSVRRWRAVEHALRLGGDGVPPTFTDPAMPFLHLALLEVHLTGGEVRTAWTYQQDTDFGLVLREGDRGRHGASGIHRPCEPALPVGRVEAVDVVAGYDVVAEVALTVAGRTVLLIAGEVDETTTGELELRRCDESVLVFADPAAADGLPWIPPRTPRTPRTPRSSPRSARG